MAKNMAFTKEPDIIKGHNPEETLQRAIKEEICKILDEKKTDGTLTTYFILERFGLDLTVVIKWSDNRCSIRLLELKAFVASRQGGVGIGNQSGEGSQIELLLLDADQMSVCDEFVRWLLIDGTRPRTTARFAFFGMKAAKNAAMGTVRKGKQNNLKVNQLMEEALTWNELSTNLKQFLVS
jgi:hypothetical protein